MSRDREDLPQAEKIRRGTQVVVHTPSFTGTLVIYRGEVVDADARLERWASGRRAAETLDRFRQLGWRVEFRPPPAGDGNAHADTAGGY
jgi:hypothetical protein